MTHVKSTSNLLKDSLLLLAGVISATIGLKGFLLPNEYLDGGVTGTSLVIERLTGWNISLLLFLLNLPFILIGIRQISKEFAIKTALAITALVLAIHSIELPHITDDKLLIAVFGGFFIGAGIGLSIRGGGVIDGTEVMAVAISRRTTLSVGDVISVFNLLLFSTSAFLFDLETAMYSMLTYLAASKTADFLITGIEEYVSITIVSAKADDIKNVLVEDMNRAVTVYKGGGGNGKRGQVNADGLILVSVVTRLEVQAVINMVYRVDPRAFVTQHTINDTKGGMIKQRPLH
jgi:uncharacterized membrane-anchored protein YitT (DUF2179 family)